MNFYIGVAISWCVVSSIVMVAIGIRHYVKNPHDSIDPYGMSALALSWIGGIYGVLASIPVVSIWLSQGQLWSWVLATTLTLFTYAIAWCMPKLYGQQKG